MEETPWLKLSLPWPLSMMRFFRSGNEVINLSIKVLAKAMIWISAPDGVAACSIVLE